MFVLSTLGRLFAKTYVRVGLGALLLGGLAAAGWWHFRRGETYASLNPHTQYVGMQTCKGCHEEIHASYLTTGMGRSFYLPRPSEQIEDFGPAAVVYDAHSDFYYRPYWQGDTLYIEEYREGNGKRTHQRTERVDYIVGSGHQTRSYILNRNGYLYEAPITWYVARRKWDLSPGYENGRNTRFDRPIGGECMTCHNGLPQLEPGTLNRYTHVPLGIDCERCHGPGQVHVERMQRDEVVDVGRGLVDYSIVNPAKLSLEEQIDVCQQCHLQGVNVPTGKQGAEYRPGMRLREVRAVYVAANPDTDAFGIASHAERMRRSACFLQSQNRLTCTTCHNPHHALQQTDTEAYRKACLSCHQVQVCPAPMAERTAKHDQCATCHMPRSGTNDIPHVSFTDHYIRVPGRAKKFTTDVMAARDVQLFCATQLQGEAANAVQDARAGVRYAHEVERNETLLNAAVAQLAQLPPPEAARLLFTLRRLPEALEMARKATTAKPQTTDEAFAAYLTAEIELAVGEVAAAEQRFRALWQQFTGFTEAGLMAVKLSLQLRPGNLQTALEARKDLETMLNTKPHDRALWTQLGAVQMNLRAFAAAQQALQRALALDPDDPATLENLRNLARYQGKTAEEARWQARLAAVHARKR